jgi:hypothetical protein
MSARRALALVVLSLLIPLSACGSSSSGGKSATKPSATAPADPAAAQTQIRANWEAFFAYTTPLDKTESLLQDGAALAQAIGYAKQEQQKTGIKQAAKVTAVQFTSPTQATVSYQLLNGTTVLLPTASGVAVLDNGTWKVSKQSFCTLVQLGANGASVPGC